MDLPIKISYADLQRVAAEKNLFFVFSGQQYISRLKRYDDIQQNCHRFIELRKLIIQNDNKIKEKASSAKTISKAYAAYIQNANQTWTSELVSNPDLRVNISMQNRLLKVLSVTNVKEQEKKARKQKDKSLENILYILENQ